MAAPITFAELSKSADLFDRAFVPNRPVRKHPRSLPEWMRVCFPGWRGYSLGVVFRHSRNSFAVEVKPTPSSGEL